MRRAVAAICVVVAAVAASACGNDGRREASPAQPLTLSGCSPVSYGGDGRPEFLVAAAVPLHGAFIDHGIQASQALKLTLERRGWQAGKYTVGLQICDDTTARESLSTDVGCRRNARAFARNRRVIGVVGPLLSGCAAAMLPTLNGAPRGPLAAANGSSTYMGLTRPGPGVSPDEPQRYLPAGRRGFARVVPLDDAQGAAIAVLAQRRGARRVYALHDGDAYGRGLAQSFTAAAGKLGLEVVGTSAWDADAHAYRDVAERVQRAGANAVFLGGYVTSNGPRLIMDLRRVLGPDVSILAADGFNQPETIVEGAGTAAEGLTITIAVLPTEMLPRRGREFAAEFEERYSQRPCCFAVHWAQAAEVLLDAIGESDGTRADVARRLLPRRVVDGLIGDFEIDRFGDTTLNTIGAYRIADGRLRFDSAVTPPPVLLSRR